MGRLHRSAHATTHWRLRAVLDALGIFDGFVDGQNETRSLRCGGQSVDLHYGRLPDATLHVVGDVFRIYVDAVPAQTLVVLLAQLVQDIRCVKSGIVAKLPVDQIFIRLSIPINYV